MQDILGKMVTSVRRELLAPDDASRSIHECAALLGLQLSSDIPETTLIVSGMRQLALRRDLLEAFEKFGDIEDAAVSSNSRGFGAFVALVQTLNYNYIHNRKPVLTQYFHLQISDSCQESFAFDHRDRFKEHWMTIAKII